MRLTRHVLTIAALALLAGCTDPSKLPSEAALQAGEAALAAVKGEAARYLPTELKALEDALAGARALYAKGEFKGALEAARELPAKAQALAAAVAARKEALTKAFADATADLPQALEAIRGRLDLLSAAKKLPKGLDAGALQRARDGLASITAGLADASAKMNVGHLAEAVAAATPLKAKAMEIIDSLSAATVPLPRK